MKLNRMTKLAVFFGLASLMLAGSAQAGTTTVATAVVNYAREVGAANTIFTLPTTNIQRAMGVVRNTSQSFFVTLALTGGLQFASGTLPSASNVSLSTSGGGAATFSLVSGGVDGSTSVIFLAAVTTSFAGFPTVQIAATGWTLRDTGAVVQSGGTAQVNVTTADSGTGDPFDSGSNTANLLVGVYGVAIPALISTTATIDVGTNRLNFLVSSPDTSTQDNGATLTLAYASTSILNAAGATFSLASTEGIQLVLTGTLSGITSFSWNPEAGGGAAAVTKALTSSDISAGSAALTITGANLAAFGFGARGLRITVDGTTTLSARTLSIQVNLALSGAAGFPSANGRTLLGANTVTTWSLNGSVLVANWANGNNAALSSRIYIWNPSSAPGAMFCSVYTLPVGTNGSVLLGTLSLGNLKETSAINVRVAEDILTPLGVPLPYTTNGGNLLLQFTIQANNCSGYTQSFSSGLAYGTTPLTRIQ